MSIINYYNSPTVINWNLDQNGQQVSLPIQNETKQVVEGKIPLEGLPDEQYRIQITGYVEINIKDKIDAPNKFKCDYTHGVLYFDQSKNGVNINISKYYSRGQFYIPSSRIWTKVDDLGNVVSTLSDIEGDLGEIASQIEAINDIAENASGIATNLETNVTLGTTLNTNLQDSISTATTKKTQLDSSISVSTTSKSNLDTSIASANTSKSNLDESIGNATTSKSNLDSSISSGNTLKTNLDGSIATGTILKGNLDTNIIDGNALKVDLPPLISDASTSKSNLDGSIVTSTTKKSELDGSINSAGSIKTNLDTSISNANSINNTLSNSTTGTIKKATDANSALNTSISNSSSSKTALDGSISTANTSKSNLDTSISSATATKSELDGSIATGNDLKGELDTIIAGTDFEQVIIDVNSLKQDQHSHDNQESVLDNLSDISGKLKYNGQDVGVGDMEKSIYDIDGDGKVDVANNSEKLDGQLPSYYAKQSDMDNKVDNSRVLTDVPLNAKFTDTVYTHPVNHPPSIISQDANNRFVTDTEKATWNDKSNFSGSYNDLSNKPSLFSGNYNDLSNKPTIPDTSTLMPKSGGVLENYREKLVTLSGTSTAINLSLANVFTHSLSGNTTYSISNAVSGQAHSFTLIITQTATVRTLTFPASVKWRGGEIPDLSTANKTYVLTFMTIDGGTTWLGMFGGEF